MNPNPYLKEHPYYKLYRSEMEHLSNTMYPPDIGKEDLSPEAQEVWEYRKELEANGLYIYYPHAYYTV